MSRRTRGAVIVLGAAAVTLGLLDLRGGPVTDAVRTAGATAIGPLQTVAGAIANPAVVWVEGTGQFASGSDRAQMWEEQAPQARDARNDQRVAALDQLLGLVNAKALQVVPGRVVAYPTDPVNLESVVIDVGLSDGVEVDEAVITGAGLIGRTIEAADGTANVRLLSAKDSAVGGRILRTGQASVVLGTGDPQNLVVRVIDPLADVQVGDAVMTFGSKDGKPFPPDLAIGIISAINPDGSGGRAITLRPAADLAALDLVGVVINAGGRGARGAVVGTPPPPAPAPVPAPQPTEQPSEQPFGQPADQQPADGTSPTPSESGF